MTGAEQFRSGCPDIPPSEEAAQDEAPVAGPSWNAMVIVLMGGVATTEHTGQGRMHQAKPPAAAAPATMVPRRLSAGVRAGWKAAKP